MDLGCDMRTITALWVLCGCGGKADDTAGTATPTGDTSGATDTDTTGGEDTGWECNPWYPCQDCGGAECGAEIGACVADGTCQPALNTWAACVLDCGNPSACAATFAASGAAAQALFDCTVASCAEVCDL